MACAAFKVTEEELQRKPVPEPAPTHQATGKEATNVRFCTTKKLWRVQIMVAGVRTNTYRARHEDAVRASIGSFRTALCSCPNFPIAREPPPHRLKSKVRLLAELSGKAVVDADVDAGADQGDVEKNAEEAIVQESSGSKSDQARTAFNFCSNSVGTCVLPRWWWSRWHYVSA